MTCSICGGKGCAYCVGSGPRLIQQSQVGGQCSYHGAFLSIGGCPGCIRDRALVLRLKELEERLAEVGHVVTDMVMSGPSTQEWHFYITQLSKAICEPGGTHEGAGAEAAHSVDDPRHGPTPPRDRSLLEAFIDAVSPFVRDVLDKPFPWQTGGQVTTWMSRDEYEEAHAALEALRD